MKPNIGWKFLGNAYNMLCHGLMYLNENDKGNAKYAIQTVIDDLEKLRNAHGPFASFASLADDEEAIPSTEPKDETTIKVSELRRIFEMADRVFEGNPVGRMGFIDRMLRAAIKD